MKLSSNYKNIFKGGCHCGNIHIELHTNKVENEFTPRTCQCDLCKQHGASWIADPDGEAKLIIKDENLTSFYRFGQKTSDFVMCKKCGILTIALCELENSTKAVLNRTAMINEEFTTPEILTNFDGETVDNRLTRRTKNWTGNVIIEGI